MPPFRQPRYSAPITRALAALLPSTLLLCGGVSSGTVNAAPVPDSLRACTEVLDNDQRLACFDREIAREIAHSVDTVGLTVRQQQQQAATAARQNGAPPPPKIPTPQIFGSITRIVRLGNGRDVITLDNGQIWVQGEAYDNFSAKPGEAVQIRSGLMGSFYMHTASGSDTRVTRQR